MGIDFLKLNYDHIVSDKVSSREMSDHAPLLCSRCRMSLVFDLWHVRVVMAIVGHGTMRSIIQNVGLMLSSFKNA